MMRVNLPSLKLSILAATLMSFAALPSAALAQHEHDNPRGYPLDWSHSHIKYHPSGSLKDQQQFEKDPRYLRHQFEERRKWEKLADDDASGRHHRRDRRNKGAGNSLHVDWAVPLGAASVAPNMSPAKFSSTGTASCSDAVVYALNATGVDTGATQQANLIGINNLYGAGNGCSTNPQVIFAYALTTGPIATSPVMSFYDNGAQVAFVSNDAAGATLHVVKYNTASGNGTGGFTPVAYPGTGSEVTPLNFSIGHTDTNSSPFIDYFNDAAYVGDDNGTLYKISPVFGGGTPQVIWSVTVALGKVLTGPILDFANGVVLVGASDGTLSAVNTATHAKINSLAVGSGSGSGGIVDPPVIVEEALGQPTYSFVTTGCGSAPGTNAVLYEASDTISGLSAVTSQAIGQGWNGGIFGFGATAQCATNNLHAPALDDNSYNGLAGDIYVCGTATTSSGGTTVTQEAPVLFSFTFPAGGGAITTPSSTSTPSGTNAADECSPITYFTSNSVEKIFMGMGQSGGTGLIQSNTVSGGTISTQKQVTTTYNGTGGTSGIVVDNDTATAGEANIYFAGVSGGNLTGGSCPTSNTSFSVSGSSTGNTVTVTGSGMTFSVGETVTVSGFGQSSFNGTFVLTSASPTTLTYYVRRVNTHTSTGGTVKGAGTCAFQLTQSLLN